MAQSRGKVGVESVFDFDRDETNVWIGVRVDVGTELFDEMIGLLWRLRVSEYGIGDVPAILWSERTFIFRNLHLV